MPRPADPTALDALIEAFQPWKDEQDLEGILQNAKRGLAQLVGTRDNDPAHAYLTLNRDGSHSAAWRLPNTYTVKNNILQHPGTAKAKKIRKAVQREIMQAERRGALGDAALPVSGKLYFTESSRSKTDPFHACGDYLRKVGRRDGNMKQRRYFYVGKRHGVQIFEPYNPVTNAPETYLNQRLIWRESDFDFEQARMNYGCAVQIEG